QAEMPPPFLPPGIVGRDPRASAKVVRCSDAGILTQEFRAAHRREVEPEELFDGELARRNLAKSNGAIDAIIVKADRVRIRVELDHQVGVSVEKFSELPADPVDGRRSPRNH